jgi:hypothetical protein
MRNEPRKSEQAADARHGPGIGARGSDRAVDPLGGRPRELERPTRIVRTIGYRDLPPARERHELLEHPTSEGAKESVVGHLAQANQRPLVAALRHLRATPALVLLPNDVERLERAARREGERARGKEPAKGRAHRGATELARERGRTAGVGGSLEELDQALRRVPREWLRGRRQKRRQIGARTAELDAPAIRRPRAHHPGERPKHHPAGDLLQAIWRGRAVETHARQVGRCGFGGDHVVETGHDRRGKLGDARPPQLGLDLEPAREDPIERREVGAVLGEPSRRHRAPSELGSRNGLLGRPGKLEREHLEDGHGEAEQIERWLQLDRMEPLGREIHRRAGDVLAIAVAAGHPDVDQDGAPPKRVDENVRGFHVAMHDAAAVQRLERGGDLLHDRSHLPEGQLVALACTTLDRLAHRLPLDHLHHEIGHAPIDAGRIDLNEVGMPQRRESRRFIPKTF